MNTAQKVRLEPIIELQKSYIHAGSRLLSTFTNNGAGGETLEFHHPDRTGTKLVTNNTANTSFEQSTLPFGTDLAAENVGTITTNQRFTSYDRSTAASLDYAVNRSYSSGTGRFTSVDPLGAGATSIGNPQSNNLYAYVGNNPIDFVDPSGLNAEAAEGRPRTWVYRKHDDGDGEFDYSFLLWAMFGGGGRGGYTSGGEIDTGGGGGEPLAPPVEQKTPIKPKTPCDTLAADSKFVELAKELWKSSINETPDKEAGGLFGYTIDYGENWQKGEPSVPKTYDGTREAKSLPGFTRWAEKTMNNLKDSVYFLYWIHTHPYSKSLQPSSPGHTASGTGSGDTGVSKYLKLTGVVVVENEFSVYGDGGKIICKGKLK